MRKKRRRVEEWKGNKDIWKRVCFETIVTCFYCCTFLKIYQTNKKYIFHKDVNRM
jgi:hypothetical protein